MEHWPASVLATRFAGQVMTGGVASRTVTVKMQLALLVEVSVAVHITVVVPAGKVEPLGGLQATGTPVEQLSVALAV